MNAASLSDALVAAGHRFSVEADGKLAILTPIAATALDARTRRAIVALGRAHGFTNICLEIAPVDAAVSGD